MVRRLEFSLFNGVDFNIAITYLVPHLSSKKVKSLGQELELGVSNGG
jgi:hypothetical protein